jgi:hypothetical protein
MSLPTGRGTRQVRSCGLVRKRDGSSRAAEMSGAGRGISVRFIDALLSRDSSSERLTYDT